jgi:hypothetical protein
MGPLFTAFNKNKTGAAAAAAPPSSYFALKVKSAVAGFPAATVIFCV